MNRIRIAAALACFAFLCVADAQLSGVAQTTVSDTTGGAQVGVFSDRLLSGSPSTANRIYADTADAWAPGAFPSKLRGQAQIRTLTADAATTGDTTVYSFVTDTVAQPCVLYSGLQRTLPTWLTTNYVATGDVGTLGGSVAALYCWKDKAAGTVNLGGNCPSAGCDQTTPMYVAGVVDAFRTIQPIASGSPDQAGFYQFKATFNSNNESGDYIRATVTRTASTVGAVSVQVYDTATGTATSGSDYTAITPTTYNWANGEGGDKCCVSLHYNAISGGNKTIILGLQSAMGGIAAAPINQTLTLQITDVGNVGNYQFTSATGSGAESATTQTGAVQRVNGGTGAVSVQVFNNGTGTGASGSDFTAISPVTFSWADGDTADKCCVNIVAGSVSADKTVVLAFQNATGGITSSGSKQTETFTIVNGGGGTPSATIVISETGGSDSNACTSGSPCSTLSKAISIANPDDIIEMRATGDTIWTYGAYTTLTRSGTAGHPITIRAQAGDTINFYPSTGSSTLSILRFDGAKYWHVTGVGATHLRLGDRSQWNKDLCGNDYRQRNTVVLVNNADYIELDHAELSGARAWAANYIDNTSDHPYFHDNDVGFQGTNNDTNPANNNAGQDCGDLFTVYGPDALFVNNSFHNGGHDNFGMFGARSVARGNTFDGSLVGQNTGYAGLRAADLYTGYTAYTDPDRSLTPYGPSLAEGNIFKGAARSVDSSHQAISKVNGMGLILRYNFVFDNPADGWQIDADPCCNKQTLSTGHLRLYHNTYYNNWDYAWGPGAVTGGTAGISNLMDNRYQNELGAEFTQNTVTPGSSKQGYFFSFGSGCSPNISIQGYPDRWLGAIFNNNQFAFHSGSDKQVRLACDPGGATVSGLAAAISQWPLVWLSNNVETTPSFVNAAARTKAGLQLNTGGGNAAAMATVTANSSGTTATLSDTWWIYDGFDLAYWGETGDYIAFYSSGGSLKGIRQVLDVNPFSTLTVTLSASISIVVGDVVRPVLKDGSTVWLNRGAPTTP
ncbi:MAG: Calx-beta domain-containing protein [Gammaproteobacteria bacterium]